ncbi:MAG: beta-propeller fold lactonase family protein, partial [Verrucomicrobiota bacterium]
MKRWTSILLGLLAVGLTTTPAKQLRVYFGTSQSKGIYVADFNADTGKLSTPKLAIEAKGVGFIALHPNGKFLYSTAAIAREGGVAAYRIKSDGL